MVQLSTILPLSGLNSVPALLAAIGVGLAVLFLIRLIKYPAVSLPLFFAQREEKARLAASLEEQVYERTRDLQKREEWFRALTELSSDWYWQMDHLGQFTTMSHGVSRFGRDPAEFIGRRRSEFMADPGDQQVRSYEALLAARQAFRDFAFVGNDANGSLRQVRLNGEPFYADDGAFAGFRGSGRDVTEEVEARAALASREALLAAVYESVEEGIAAFGPDMRVLAWNKRYETLHGFPPFTLQVGTPFIDLARSHAAKGDYGPGDRDGLVDARLALIDLERPQDSERVRPQGTVLEVRSRPMAGGGIVLTYLDVTVARRREAEKEQARATLRGVFDTVGVGIVVVDEQDCITMVNPTAERLFGWSAAELTGRKANTLFGRSQDTDLFGILRLPPPDAPRRARRNGVRVRPSRLISPLASSAPPDARSRWWRSPISRFANAPSWTPNRPGNNSRRRQ